MDGRQIDKCLELIPDFIGVFCADQLAKLDPVGDFSLVVNTDNCDQSGTHWQAIVVKGGKCNFFCSFGGEPEVPAIREFCERFGPCIYNNHKHQRVDRATCGGFVIYFIWAMACGQTHAQIVKRFKCMTNDDDFITRFMNQFFSAEMSLR